MRIRTGAFAAAVVGALLYTSAASAQKPPTPAPAAAPPAAAKPPTPAPAAAAPSGQSLDSTDPVDRARVHYERGLQLFNEENYDAALFEFDRAYELAPSYKILYNMGRIQRQQNNYAAAMRSYTRYLHEGGAAVPAERRKEVEGEIEMLKPRVANIKVTVNVDGADVYADDIPVCTATIESSCVGKSPLLAPIIVNGGRHKVTATKKGYAPATSLVSVVGSDTVDIKLDLVSYDRPVADPGPRNRALVAWGVTAALTGTAVIFGVLALNSNDKLANQRDQFGIESSTLSSQSKTVKTQSILADAFGAGAIISAGVATYFTIKAFRSDTVDKGKVEVGVGPTFVGLRGSM